MKTGVLLNGLVLGALALAGSAWTLLAFGPQAHLAESNETLTGDFQWGERFTAEENSVFVANGRDSVTLLEGADVLVTWDDENQHVNLELFAGSVLFATVANDFSVSVQTDFIRVDSQNSTALVTLADDGTSASVFALNHPSLVTFMEDEMALNALNVPDQYRMTIPAAKVTETLKKLRLTKLTKEFPVYVLGDGDVPEEALNLLEESADRYAEEALAFTTELQDASRFGPATSGFGSALVSGYESFQDALTVVPTAQERLTASRKNDALIYAMSHLAYGDETTGNEWLSVWQSYPQEVGELKELYSDLNFVLPGDDLYPVKQAVSELLYSEDEPLTALRREFIQIESLLQRASQVDALKAYEAYQEQFEKALQAGDFDDPEQLLPVSREYTLLELMLRSNAVFYNASATHLLSALEDKILSLAGSDADLDEERQAFVQSKLRFLNNLFTFVIDKKITVDVATNLADELLFEAETYLNAISAQVAVRDYFEDQIAEYKFSVQFMNSSEFYSYDSFEEGLDDYKIKLADLEDLSAYLQGLRVGDEEVASLTLEEATAQAKEDLYTHAIQYKDVESLGDSANRLFEIVGGRTAGYAFEAKYDRESQILYDVVVEGDLRFSTGLTLENAKTVIESAMVEGNLVEEEETEEAIDSVENSLTESVALEHAEALFEEAGLSAEDFVLTVVDLEENLFSFEGVVTSLGLPVSGSFDSDTGLLTELVWEWNGEPHTLSDTPLEDLETTVEASYEDMN